MSGSDGRSGRVPRIEYGSGDELSPTNPYGRFALTVAEDGSARLEHHQLAGVRAWSASLDPVVWPRLLSTLRNAGFPAVGTPPIPPGSTVREVSLIGAEPAGNLALGWGDVDGAGLAEPFLILDSLVRQIGGAALAAVRNELPNLVQSRVPDESLPEPAAGVVGAAAFGTVRGRPGYAIVTPDRQFRTFAVADGARLGSSAAADSPVRAVAIGGVGGRDLLAVGDDDGRVRVWDTETGDLLHDRGGPQGPVFAVAAGEDGRHAMVLCAGLDGWVRAWYARSAEERGAIPGGAALRGVCWARVDGRDLVAFGGDSGTVRVVRLADGVESHVLRGHAGGVNAVALLDSPGGGLLASAGQDRLVRVWDLRTGYVRHALEGHGQSVTGLAFASAPGRSLLVSCALDGTIRTWDPVSGESLGSFPAGSPWPAAVAAVPSGAGTAVLVGGDAGTVYARDALSGAEIAALRQPGGRSLVTGIAAARIGDRTTVAVAHGGGTLRLWDLDRRSVLGEALPGDGTPTSVALASTEDGPVLLCGTDDGTVRAHDASSGAVSRVFTPHTGKVLDLAFTSVAGRPVLVSGGMDGTLRTWDALYGAPLLRLPADARGVAAVAAGQVGGASVIASAGYGRAVRVWDAATGEPRLAIHGHPLPVYRLAFGGYGGRDVIASGSYDGTVRVWDAATGEQALALDGNPGTVTALCFGEVMGTAVLAVGTDDGMVRLWELSSGTKLSETGAPSRPLAISFAPSGAVLVAGQDGLTTLDASRR